MEPTPKVPVTVTTQGLMYTLEFAIEGGGTYLITFPSKPSQEEIERHIRRAHHLPPITTAPKKTRAKVKPFHERRRKKAA